MKQNNNLIKITNVLTGEIHYFTKDSYVRELLGCSTTAMYQLKAGGSPKYQNWRYQIVDGSEIKYKDINILNF